MIVRQEKDGEQLLIGQTDHSRLAGQFAAHWWATSALRFPSRLNRSCAPQRFTTLGYLRYETGAGIPRRDSRNAQLPQRSDQRGSAWKNTSRSRLASWGRIRTPPTWRECIVAVWWRGRYAALTYPPHNMRPQKPEVEVFAEKNEAIVASAMATNGWGQATGPDQLPAIAVLGSPEFVSCLLQAPADDHMEPVLARYSDTDAEGVKVTLAPLDARTIA